MKTQKDLLTQMLGEEESPFLTAGGTQIKSLAGEETEIVVNTLWVTAANTGYALPVTAAGEKMFCNIHNTSKMELAITIGISFFIEITEIFKMFLKNGMQHISSSRHILILVFQIC